MNVATIQKQSAESTIERCEACEWQAELMPGEYSCPICKRPIGVAYSFDAFVDACDIADLTSIDFVDGLDIDRLGGE